MATPSAAQLSIIAPVATADAHRIVSSMDLHSRIVPATPGTQLLAALAILSTIARLQTADVHRTVYMMDQLSPIAHVTSDIH